MEHRPPGFLWVQTKPANHAHFNRFMTAQHMGMPVWLDVYPIGERIQNLGPDQPLFVDVGGGVSHQSALLRERLPPGVENRIIVQDLAATLQHAIPHEGVETMVQDFFQPQAVKGTYILIMSHRDSNHEKLIILRVL